MDFSRPLSNATSRKGCLELRGGLRCLGAIAEPAIPALVGPGVVSSHVCLYEPERSYIPRCWLGKRAASSADIPNCRHGPGCYTSCLSRRPHVLAAKGRDLRIGARVCMSPCKYLAVSALTGCLASLCLSFPRYEMEMIIKSQRLLLRTHLIYTELPE